MANTSLISLLIFNAQSHNASFYKSSYYSCGHLSTRCKGAGGRGSVSFPGPEAGEALASPGGTPGKRYALPLAGRRGSATRFPASPSLGRVRWRCEARVGRTPNTERQHFQRGKRYALPPKDGKVVNLHPTVLELLQPQP